MLCGPAPCRFTARSGGSDIADSSPNPFTGSSLSIAPVNAASGPSAVGAARVIVASGKARRKPRYAGTAVRKSPSPSARRITTSETGPVVTNTDYGQELSVELQTTS